MTIKDVLEFVDGDDSYEIALMDTSGQKLEITFAGLGKDEEKKHLIVCCNVEDLTKQG